jgi:hypothetical protein
MRPEHLKEFAERWPSWFDFNGDIARTLTWISQMGADGELKPGLRLPPGHHRHRRVAAGGWGAANAFLFALVAAWTGLILG